VLYQTLESQKNNPVFLFLTDLHNQPL
jgi:hypothetical protein